MCVLECMCVRKNLYVHVRACLKMCVCVCVRVRTSVSVRVCLGV